MNLKCAQCGTFELEMSMFVDKDGNFLGQWPLRYWGTKPTEPHLATHYFCGPYCANDWAKANFTQPR